MAHTRYHPAPSLVDDGAEEDGGSSGPDPSEGPLNPRITLVAICLASLAVATDGSIITVALPRISSSIDLMDHFGWSSGAFLLTACVAQPIFGRFYNSGYRKGPLIYGVIAYHVGGTLCACSRSQSLFVIGRAVSGIGASSLYVGSQVLIVSICPPADLAISLSAISFASTLWGTLLPTLAGAVIDWFSWRLVFFLNLPFSVVGGIVLARVLRAGENQNTNEKWYRLLVWTDCAGTVILVVAFACLALPLTPDSNGWLMARLLAFVVSVCAFAWLQWLFPTFAMVRPEIFCVSQVWMCAVVSCLLEVGIFTQLFYLPLFYQAVKDMTTLQSGTQEMLYMLTMATASLVSGAMVKRVGGARYWLALGIFVFAMSAFLLCGLKPDSDMLRWIIPALGSAFGAGLSLQLPFAIVGSELEHQRAVEGNTILVFSHSFGGPIATLVAHVIFKNVMLENLEAVKTRIDPHTIVSAGPALLRAIVPKDLLSQVLEIYCHAINSSLILAVIATAIAGLFTSRLILNVQST